MLLYFIAFLVLIPTLVSGSGSKPLVALMKNHYQEDHWNDCMIITLGLELKFIKDLVKTAFIARSNVVTQAPFKFDTCISKNVDLG